ncbi:MAG: NUDIX hydrolase [Anaerolineae bacterium]|jgi:8-oxo-dGTP diphosphatase
MSIHDYPHPALTVDVVLLATGNGNLQVLLIQRHGPPFEGRWALPGGFVELGESPEDAASRELEEETGVRGVRLEQMRAFGDPGRDPRGHVVTLVFWGLLDGDRAPGQPPCPVEAGSDADVARWWSIGGLPPLAFDHADILAYALRYLPGDRANAAAPPPTGGEVAKLSTAKLGAG